MNFGTTEWVAEFVRKGGRALAVRQPWAWLIMNAGKDIENRDWQCHYRGYLLIHASKECTRYEYEDGLAYAEAVMDEGAFGKLEIPGWKEMDRGCLLGTVKVGSCVVASGSPWFEGTYGIVLDSVRPFARPLPCRGALRLFRPVPSPLPLSEIRGFRG
jgi:hypothetical protein